MQDPWGSVTATRLSSLTGLQRRTCALVSFWGAVQSLLLPCVVEAWTALNVSVGLVQKHVSLLKGSADIVALEERNSPGAGVEV